MISLIFLILLCTIIILIIILQLRRRKQHLRIRGNVIVERNKILDKIQEIFTEEKREDIEQMITKFEEYVKSVAEDPDKKKELKLNTDELYGSPLRVVLSYGITTEITEPESIEKRKRIVIRMTEVLLQHVNSETLNVKDNKYNKTPLIMAVETNIPKIVDLLIQHGASFENLELASIVNDVNMFRYLHKEKQYISWTKKEGIYLLFLSLMFGNIEKFDYLLKNGAGTTGEQYNDVVDNELLLSSLTFWKDCQITIKRLIKNKDDSLLLMAVRYYRPAFVKLLMEVARSPIDDLKKNKDDGKDALNVPIYARRTHCVLKRGSQEEINLRKPIVQKMLGLSPEQAA